MRRPEAIGSKTWLGWSFVRRHAQSDGVACDAGSDGTTASLLSRARPPGPYRKSHFRSSWLPPTCCAAVGVVLRTGRLRGSRRRPKTGASSSHRPAPTRAQGPPTGTRTRRDRSVLGSGRPHNRLPCHPGLRLFPGLSEAIGHLPESLAR